jgi:hypothetical protein
MHASVDCYFKAHQNPIKCPLGLELHVFDRKIQETHS